MLHSCSAKANDCVSLQAAASRRAAADHSGCMSRMELEIYASDLKIALRREKRKVEELEGKLKQARRESRALHERIADLTIRAGGEEALQALRDEKKLVDEELVRVKEQLRLLSGDSSGGEALRVLHVEKKSVDEELLQAKDQLRRFNKEQVRDGRTIAELSEWCEKLQARLAEATIASAEQYQTQKVQLQEQQPASGGHSNSSPALCKRLPASQRSDTGPQLAKKLPSPAGHKLAASLERAPAMRPSPSAISVTRPKEASWFDGFSLGGNSASGQEGSKAPVAADSQYWFGRGNPLDKLLGVEALTGSGGSASSPAQPPADAKGSRTPQYA